MGSMLDYLMMGQNNSNAAKERQAALSKQREILSYTPEITPTERALLMGTQGDMAPQVLAGVRGRKNAANSAGLINSMGLTPQQQARLAYGVVNPGASGAASKSVFSPDPTAEQKLREFEDRQRILAKHRAPPRAPTGLSFDEKLALHEGKKEIDARLKKEAAGTGGSSNQTQAFIQEAIGLSDPTTTGIGGFFNRAGETVTGAFTGEQGPARRLDQIMDKLKATNWKSVVGGGQLSPGDYKFLDRVFATGIDAPADERVNALKEIGNWLAAKEGRPEPYPGVANGSVETTEGGAPQVGDVRKGYRFKGGNPSRRDSWERVGADAGS